jgi:hypothetical protein
VKYDLIIIGGGAAGSATASFIKNKKVLIIEKNSQPMKKLAITGKGRCNLTNNCDVEAVLSNLTKNSMFMRSALSKLTPQDTMAFFEDELGVPLKTERGGRVFPVSNQAGDIVGALKASLKKSCGVEMVTDRVTELIIDHENNSVTGVKTASGGRYSSSAVLIATGGKSYPKTGSTGDGYELAKQAGHTIMPISPALVPLETAEDVSELAGLSLKNVRLTLEGFSEMGEMLFTHFGVSGPLVLSASMYINQLSIVNCKLSIDLKPALDEKTLDNRILRDFSNNKNRQFKNSLSGLLPEKLISVFIKRSGISPNQQVNEITREERQRLLRLFKGFELTVRSLRPIDEAVVTDGGVCVKEINPKTMQSKLVQGLYFAGEVIDVVGFTGGFNLQVAWSSGKAVAVSIEGR